MTRRAVPLALALLTAAAAPPAAAEPGHGQPCGYALLLREPVSDGVLNGEIDGGPIMLAADGTGTGRLVCSLQAVWWHGAADLVRVSSATTTGAAVVPPTPFSMTVPEDNDVFFCTEVQVDGGGTYYWDADHDRWTTDDATASCDVVIPDEGGPWELNDMYEVVDPIVCQPMAVVWPPQGDVPGIWDCPPYA